MRRSLPSALGVPTWPRLRRSRRLIRSSSVKCPLPWWSRRRDAAASMKGRTMKLLHKVQGVQYELFDMYALDEMAPMVAEAFNRYEPMTVAQGIPFQEFVDFVKLL